MESLTTARTDAARRDDDGLAIVADAVQRGLGAVELERLIALQERVSHDRARCAYHAAVAAAKLQLPPTIYRSHSVDYQTKGGRRVRYSHADLADVIAAVTPILAQHGLTIAWRTTQVERQITVECVLSHAMGHSERCSLTAAPDDRDGLNALQAVCSSVTYLERYTARALLGIAEGGQDDDARSASPSTREATADQIARLRGLADDERIADTGRAAIRRALAVGTTVSVAESLIERAEAAIRSRERDASVPVRESDETAPMREIGEEG